MLARIALLMLCHAACCDAAAIASGRNWRLSIDSIECQAAESLVVVGTQVRYLGPGGPVEAPVTRLVDDKGKPYLPRSLVWRAGSRQLAELLSSGGLRNIQPDSAGIELKFPVPDATGELKLEFGDIRAFSLTRKRTSACEGFLPPDRIRGPRAARAARVDSSKLGFPVHRARYPCSPASRIIAAEYPPYVPRHMLLFGHGFLPNARQIELPMGRAAVQSYSYTGPDNIVAVEDAARRAVLADFPEYANRSKYFAFNWGAQKSATGNEVYSIGIYDLRPCPK